MSTHESAALTLAGMWSSSSSRGSEEEEERSAFTGDVSDGVRDRSREDANGRPKRRVGGRWTSAEHALFLKGLAEHGHSWRTIEELVKTRSKEQVRCRDITVLLTQHSGLHRACAQIRAHARKYFLNRQKEFSGGAPCRDAGDVHEAPHCGIGVPAGIPRNSKRRKGAVASVDAGISVSVEVVSAPAGSAQFDGMLRDGQSDESVAATPGMAGLADTCAWIPLVPHCAVAGGERDAVASPISRLALPPLALVFPAILYPPTLRQVHTEAFVPARWDMLAMAHRGPYS